jgi:thiamine pyrophosphokinase
LSDAADADPAEAVEARGARGRKGIVVGNGRCPDRDGLPAETLDDAQIVVAADGGVACALALGLRPDVVVGDADSLELSDLNRLGQLGIPLVRVSPHKDASDLELAVREAVGRGARSLVILGALDGDRVEHSMANLMLLTLPELARADASIVDERSTVRVLDAADTSSAALRLSGQAGDFISLFPWAGPAEGITTEGLRYPLRDEPLPVGPSRGLSNELVGTSATVRLRGGRLLVVHTRRGRTKETET